MPKNDLEHTKMGDLISEIQHEWGSKMESLLGSWKNVNPKTGQLNRVEVFSRDETLFLHAYGKLEDGEKDLGTTRCELFSSNVGSPEIEGFFCAFHFDFMKIRMAGNMKYGVMVIQAYNTFTDGSNRNDYFSREFFCKK